MHSTFIDFFHICLLHIKVSAWNEKFCAASMDWMIQVSVHIYSFLMIIKYKFICTIYELYSHICIHDRWERIQYFIYLVFCECLVPVITKCCSITRDILSFFSLSFVLARISSLEYVVNNDNNNIGSTRSMVVHHVKTFIRVFFLLKYASEQSAR